MAPPLSELPLRWRMMRAVATLAAFAIVVALSWSLEPSAFGGIDCPLPVLLDETLLCDPKALCAAAAACGLDADANERTWKVRAGDRIARPDLCRTLAGSQEMSAGRMSPLSQAALEIPVDLNHGALEDYQSLPGIGPGLAQRLQVHLQREGPFRGPADVLRVKGIGMHRWEAIRARARFDGPKCWVIHMPCRAARLPRCH